MQSCQPGIIGNKVIRALLAGIYCLSKNGGHLGDIGWTSLSSFDLDSGDTNAHQLRQYRQHVQTRRFLNRVACFTIDLESAFADRRVTGVLIRAKSIDEYIVDACFEIAFSFCPADELRR